jgi:uroporphyrin-III C-methyltransferase
VSDPTPGPSSQPSETASFATDLDVRGRHVVVCGGGPGAYGPISALVAAGARLTVYDRQPGTTVRDLAERGLLVLRDAELNTAELDGVALVVPATGRPEEDRQVSRLAAEHGVLAVAPAAAPRPAAPEPQTGSVTLVGGGPGDPGLITVAGLDAVRNADVLVCDRLAPLSVLEQARSGAEIIDVAKIPRGAFTSQGRINAILIEQARAGRTVVRLKGGDNFIFGRGGEEWQACAAAGIPVRIIPGVSSALAGPALAGIPLTHRQLTQGFTVVSGHLPPGDPDSTLDWSALARTNTTLVILMGVATLAAVSAELIRSGMSAATPAITVASAGLPSQREVRGPLSAIAHLTHEAGIQPPAITVIGAVAAFAP